MTVEPCEFRGRWIYELISAKLKRPYVHILFGARQTGKSTLLNSILPEDALRINLADPAERNLHLARPASFSEMCRALSSANSPHTVFVDEAQTVPTIFDAVQSLYDSDKERWRFVLCGSSARKLRRSGANLLLGRCFLHHLYPLVMAEHPSAAEYPLCASPLPLPWPGGMASTNPFPSWDINDRLAYGALPGIVLAEEEDRADLLRAFAEAHIEEEIRREAMVKDWGAFLRFLQLAARESGQILNYTAIARESGISVPTVKSHYQLLEDMFLGFHIPAFSGSQRKNLLSTPRFCFFDLGVRNASAGLTPGRDTVKALGGSLFEQWVGIELWKRLQYQGNGRLLHMRTEDGAEVDYVIEKGEELIPVEVKWAERPFSSAGKHVRNFLREHPGKARRGWLVCRCARPMQLEENITALPWFCL